ncbi:MAG: membrane biogenesis protein [Clostridia bacterium]|nr:membrane biogenesis protein [Clostridia bacterium]
MNEAKLWKTDFFNLFPNQKPVIAMLHLKADGRMSMLERAQREIELYCRYGVQAVLVENYFGSAADCAEVLHYLHQHHLIRCYGVNILGDSTTAFKLAEEYRAAFIQIDSVSGHLPPAQDAKLEARLTELHCLGWPLVLGGVRFKYQPVLSGRTLAEDIRAGMRRCDAIVTTGEGTGSDTPTEKLMEFKRYTAGFPLIAGAGVTADTVREKLSICDGVIVGSWFKEGHDAFGEVDEANVKAFMDAI